MHSKSTLSLHSAPLVFFSVEFWLLAYVRMGGSHRIGWRRGQADGREGQGAVWKGDGIWKQNRRWDPWGFESRELSSDRIQFGGRSQRELNLLIAVVT